MGSSWPARLAAALLIASVSGSLGTALLTGKVNRADPPPVPQHSDLLVSGVHPFREELAAAVALRAHGTVTPFLAFRAVAGFEADPKVTVPVALYGVDERYWRFHGITPPAGTLLSPALAARLGPGRDPALLVRIENPSPVPRESVFGAEQDPLKTLRVPVSGILGSVPHSSDPLAVFMPLALLQADLGLTGKVNRLLVDTRRSPALVAEVLKESIQLSDVGVAVRDLDDGIALESDAIVLSDDLVALGTTVASRLRLQATPLLSVPVKAIRIDDGLIADSFLAAVPPQWIEAPGPAAIVLNEWAADQLEASEGETVAVEFPEWSSGVLSTRRENLTLSAITTIEGLAADPGLVPEPAAAAGSTAVGFLPIETGRRFWGSQFGSVTSLRITPTGGFQEDVMDSMLDAYRTALKAAIDPLRLGMRITGPPAHTPESGGIRWQPILQSGALVSVPAVSLLVLAALFSRIGKGSLRDIFVLSLIGSPLGMPAALAIKSPVLDRLAFALTGAAAGATLLLALVALGIALRLARTTPSAPSRFGLWIAMMSATTGVALAAQGALRTLPMQTAFLAAAAFFLIAILGAVPLRGTGSWPAALIACGVFAVIASEGLRPDNRSGAGAFEFFAESQLPVLQEVKSQLAAPDRAWQLRLRDEAGIRVVGAPQEFLEVGRFQFSESLASNDAERRNPWLLLLTTQANGAIPAIADEVLLSVEHRKLGDEILLAPGVRMKVVATLRDSILRHEWILSEADFLRYFPQDHGYRTFLLDTQADRAVALQAALSGFGLTVEATTDRLARMHEAWNASVSGFQRFATGGLLLGLTGLALLRRLNPGARALRSLLTGVASGAACGLAAAIPISLLHGVPLSFVPLAEMLAAVLVVGLAAARMPTSTPPPAA